MEMFYVGLHQASDACHFTRLCINVERLEGRKKALGCQELLLDSRAFKTLELHGEHRLSEQRYADLIHQIACLCPEVTPVSQDYMCERYIFEQRYKLTGRWYTVADHQRLTIERFDKLRLLIDRELYLMPVLQGWTPREYASHVEQYGDRLPLSSWVGVGSVCKRNSNPVAIKAVLQAIKAARPDLRLHGFGVKQTSLASDLIRTSFYSADSMAWSFAARKQGRNANDWREGAAFAARIEARHSLGPLFDAPGRA